MFIENTEKPFLICPEKYEIDGNEKVCQLN
jgi:hypothetical protein